MFYKLNRNLRIHDYKTREIFILWDKLFSDKNKKARRMLQHSRAQHSYRALDR